MFTKENLRKGLKQFLCENQEIDNDIKLQLLTKAIDVVSKEEREKVVKKPKEEREREREWRKVWERAEDDDNLFLIFEFFVHNAIFIDGEQRRVKEKHEFEREFCVLSSLLVYFNISLFIHSFKTDISHEYEM